MLTVINPNSIAIGPNDYPQIGYCDDGANEVMLAKWDGAVWNTETVFDPDYINYADLNIEYHFHRCRWQQPGHFLFNETRYGSKVYSSTWDGSAWQTELVDMGGNLAHRNDIATDKHGLLPCQLPEVMAKRFDDTGHQINFPN